MASQPITAAAVVEISSYVRGYHAYQEKWHPLQGDVLQLAREPTNATEKLAIAVIKKTATLWDMSPTTWHLLFLSS